MLAPHRITAVGDIVGDTDQGANGSEPVVMVTLLKFRNGTQDGRVVDHRHYGDVALDFVAHEGGRVLWAGTGDQVLTAGAGAHWDAVLLVEYPSHATYAEITARPEYRAALARRGLAVERAMTIACAPAPFDTHP
jgi:uncharacterized protein (DUF1330 family)